MSRRMFGVVLWADQTDRKAVIWCEDHGDLAYWHEPEISVHDGASAEPDLDVGDLVQFDLSEGPQLRRARNPQRLESQQFFGLAQSLRAAGERPVSPAQARRSERRVIAFPGARGRQRDVA